MIKEAIAKIVNKGDLTYDEAYTVLNEIMSGETSATQNAAFSQPFPRRAHAPRRPMRSRAVPQQCAPTQHR